VVIGRAISALFLLKTLLDRWSRGNMTPRTSKEGVLYNARTWPCCYSRTRGARRPHAFVAKSWAQAELENIRGELTVHALVPAGDAAMGGVCICGSDKLCRGDKGASQLRAEVAQAAELGEQQAGLSNRRACAGPPCLARIKNVSPLADATTNISILILPRCHNARQCKPMLRGLRGAKLMAQAGSQGGVAVGGYEPPQRSLAKEASVSRRV